MDFFGCGLLLLTIVVAIVVAVAVHLIFVFFFSSLHRTFGNSRFLPLAVWCVSVLVNWFFSYYYFIFIFFCQFRCVCAPVCAKIENCCTIFCTYKAYKSQTVLGIANFGNSWLFFLPLLPFVSNFVSVHFLLVC